MVNTMKLSEYLKDGAKIQEVCIMAYVRNYYDAILSESFDKEAYEENRARIDIARYHNCREQGYTICLSYRYVPVVYITFFEHRNSDKVCLLINKNKVFSECPTPDEVWEGRKDKWDYDESFDCMHIEQCGDYIINVLKDELHRVIEEDRIIKEWKSAHTECHYISAEKRLEIWGKK